MDETFHPYCEKKIHQLSISCQTLPSKTAKFDTVRLLNSNQNIVQYTFKFKLGKNFNLGPLKNYLEFDLFFCILKFGTNLNFEAPLNKT